MQITANIQETNGGSVTVGLPKTINELRKRLHGYRIRNTGNRARTNRASIIYEALGLGNVTPATHRAARELAELDPSLSWLPDWKPRVAVKGGG